MKLAIVGRQPLDELEAMVRDKFSLVKDQQLSLQELSSDIYLSEVCHMGMASGNQDA